MPIAVFLLFAVKSFVVLRWPDCSISRSTPWASGEHFSLAGNRGSLYAVRPGVRSSSLILAMFAAMRRVSLRFPERLRRFGWWCSGFLPYQAPLLASLIAEIRGNRKNSLTEPGSSSGPGWRKAAIPLTQRSLRGSTTAIRPNLTHPHAVTTITAPRPIVVIIAIAPRGTWCIGFAKRWSIFSLLSFHAS